MLVVMYIKPATLQQTPIGSLMIITVGTIGEDTHVLALLHRQYRQRILKVKPLIQGILMEM